MMINALPPALILILGGLLVPLFKGRARQVWLLVLPIISFINLLQLPDGSHWAYPFLSDQIVLARVDKLSLIFGYIFHLVAFLSALYALHVDDTVQNVAGTVSVGNLPDACQSNVPPSTTTPPIANRVTSKTAEAEAMARPSMMPVRSIVDGVARRNGRFISDSNAEADA